MAGLLRSLTGWGRLEGGRRHHGLDAAGLGVEALIAVVENSIDPMMISGRAGEVYYANAAYFALAGLPEDSFMAPGIATLMRGDEKQADRLYRLQKAARDGETSQEVLKFFDQQAVQHRYDVRVAPLQNANGASVWALRRIEPAPVQAEQAAIQKIKDDLFDIIINAPVGLVAVGKDGQVAIANPRFASWIGVDPLSLMADRRNIRDLFEGPLSPWAKGDDSLDAAVSGPLIKFDRATLLGQEGARIPVSIIYLIHHGKNGDAGEMQLVIRDLRDDTAMDLTATGDVEARFLRLFNIAPVGIVIVDQEAKILEVNTAFRQRFYAIAVQGGNFLELVAHDYRNDVRRKISEALEQNRQDGHIEIQIGSGENIRSAQLFVTRMPEADAASVVLYLVDITEQKNLELQFSQSQKMQAVGQLAGGIAHDFNNLLTAIIGYSDLLLGRHNAGDPSFSDIHQIKQNASRAANLVRQLLAFSRQQTLKPKVVSLTDMLAELNNLLRRLLGDNVELTMIHGRNLGKIKADQGQLENVIINLAVNARDAMGPNGGAIRIRTENVSASEARALDHAWMPPSDCVLIEVADNGPGIPKEIMGKIFEPFFTTKEVGKGTGLGLSTAYGIIKQQGGNIYVMSEPENGAVFRIYLPRFEEDETEAVAAPLAESEPADLTGKGLILLVEDEEPVRAFVSRALEGKGYTVLEASGGEMALEIMRANAGRIDLMISDVMMPNMDGASLLKEIRLLAPGTKVIFISGYAEDAFRNNDEPLGDFVFLPKPFTLRQLAARVKEVMGNN